MYKDIEDVDCCNTNLDYLDFWMSSVYSLTSSSPIRQDAIVSDSKNSPPVFLVFTHADEPYCEKDPRELALEVYGILRDQSKIYRGHLFKDVFVVDNTKSGSDSECQEVVRLREDILTVAKNLLQMKEPIPLKWLMYETILQLLNKEGYKWIPVEKARQVATEKCGIDDSKQFQTLLNFLHDQKMLIHFNETPELNNMVILDPQWLIDIFKRVITIPRYEPSEDCVEELWRNLEKTGILDERLLEHAWKPLVDGQETINSLIAIMERFSLLCPWPSNDTNKQYLVPSMLMSPASDDVLELLASVEIPSLFVRFESDQVPPGLFSRLVLQFYQRCKEEWKSPVNPELFDNFALFHIRPDQGTSVIWLCHSSFIEVAIYTADDSSGTVKDFNDCNFDSTTGHSINRQLRSILECMREEFHWLKTMRYEMCVCCPVCSQKGSPKCRSHDVRGCGCLHLLSESDLEERQFCTRPGVRGDIRIDINMFTSWFEFSNVRKRFSSLQPQDASGGVLDERTNKSSRKGDTKEKDDKERMDDRDGDNASEEISESGEQLPRKQHQIEEEAKKTRVHEGTVTSEGTQWDLKLGTVHLTFPPNAVTKPTLIVVHKWESSVCSPQLQEHEAIVSNVIGISTTTNEALQFKVGVKLVFSHCAPDLLGYELVIKRLINKETNDWKEVEGTADARQLSDIEDEYPKEVPDFSFPVVQVNITECSIFTVICRLIPSPTYTISSRGGCFHHPDYPGVAVTVPKKAVSVKLKFPLHLKVQEVPNDEFKDGNVYVGPILRISCTQGLEFLKPVTIQLPVAPRVEGGTIPDPSICRVRVLFLKSDGEKKEWVDITDDLENPARFDGTSVTFQVKRFSGYAYIIIPHTAEQVAVDPNFLSYLQYITRTTPITASFFAYFRPSDRIGSRDLLHLVCCPAHLNSQVKEDLDRVGVSPHEVYEITSRGGMIPGHDKAFVLVSGGISPVNEEYMGEVYLMLDASCPHRNQLPIRLISNQEYCLVEFRNFAELRFRLPFRQMQFETSSGFRVKLGNPTDEELQAIAGRIGGKWKALGRQLTIQESQLTGFDRDQPDEYEKAYAVLVDWKQRGGSENATYQILKEALCHALVGRRDLAEEFCCLNNSVS